MSILLESFEIPIHEKCLGGGNFTGEITPRVGFEPTSPEGTQVYNQPIAINRHQRKRPEMGMLVNEPDLFFGLV